MDLSLLSLPTLGRTSNHSHTYPYTLVSPLLPSNICHYLKNASKNVLSALSPGFNPSSATGFMFSTVLFIVFVYSPHH